LVLDSIIFNLNINKKNLELYTSYNFISKLLSWIAMLKHEMSEYALVKWFMGCEWWVWHDLGV